ncbi:5,10-methenyltetrahydrofolate synthetase [Coxiella endosymbiont of Amblyomma americanum]|nr:5-formyltetrahydrofolate cyclo-ligase [Coxiella endosymbiont of Amblyomma americanum]AJC50376.1 5,10-methenyltetrahydrofolate synthetase [Coxiella endosymbiont of Amblyomma americanum]AUJ58719.1 5-formyltetrahydrofolate cyclo-ligase [Coxiella-like endosymbiont of Amblyomma americanum]
MYFFFPYKKKLRVLLSQYRNSLSLRERCCVAQKIYKKIIALRCFMKSRNLSFYRASNGEVNIDNVVATAKAMGKNCYLPVLYANERRLKFYSYLKNSLIKNRFNIEEPDISQEKCISLSNLDLIFLPLLAFDMKGNRLGRGGGYYDQTLESLKNRNLKKPVLVGIAYEFQKIDTIPIEKWDIPLDLVITEQKIYQF